MIIFLNTGEDVNEGWERLTKAYRRHDTRAFHIRDFENVLSPCLRKPLAEHEEYQKIEQSFSLPKLDRVAISDEEFRGRIFVFEMIMRANGIIGYSEDKQIEEDDQDMLGVYFGSGGGKA